MFGFFPKCSVIIWHYRDNNRCSFESGIFHEIELIGIAFFPFISGLSRNIECFRMEIPLHYKIASIDHHYFHYHHHRSPSPLPPSPHKYLHRFISVVSLSEIPFIDRNTTLFLAFFAHTIQISFPANAKLSMLLIPFIKYNNNSRR